MLTRANNGRRILEVCSVFFLLSLQPCIGPLSEGATSGSEATTSSQTLDEDRGRISWGGISFELPGEGWTRIPRGDQHIFFGLQTGEHRSKALSVSVVDVHPSLRDASRETLVAMIFDGLRNGERPPGEHWEGFQQGERLIDESRYPVMTYRVTRDSAPDSASDGLLLVHFPVDFDSRKRFFYLNWVDVHPASELGQEQIDLEMFDQLISSLASGVDQVTAQTIESATGDRHPSWQLQMDEARRQIANGDNYVLMGPSGVFVFYNNPQPFCYRYMIPGEWVAAQEGNLYQSKDGLAHAGVSFTLTQALEGLKGKTFAERAQSFIARGYKVATGHRLKGVKLTPFESSRFPVWKFTADPPKQGRDTRVELATKFVVDLGPDAFAVITVGGTGDDDALARGIIDSLQTTTDAACYWSDLETMLRSQDSQD